MTKVSIIVPIYGVEKYIERCAVSLFEQTYEDIEYIFVNDATQDKSIAILTEVIKRYPQREKAIHIIHRPVNKGLSAARNTGLKHATGDYVWHVDSDDYVAKNAVQDFVEIAEEHQADIVICDVNVITARGIQTEAVNYSTKDDYIRRLLQHLEKCAHWNKFYRKALLDATGIRSDEQIRLAEDYAVTPRLLYLAERVEMLHEALYYYETRNQSSYVHNLSRSAIESHQRADAILTTFFANKPEYQDIISILPQRSMTSLIKNSDREGWPVVTEIYKEALSHSGKGLTEVNRIIYTLAKRKLWGMLKVFMAIYHLIMRN
jgi:glycosyltransferase involved in cell wall biosynthesis